MGLDVTTINDLYDEESFAQSLPVVNSGDLAALRGEDDKSGQRRSAAAAAALSSLSFAAAEGAVVPPVSGYEQSLLFTEANDEEEEERQVEFEEQGTVSTERPKKKPRTE